MILNGETLNLVPLKSGDKSKTYSFTLCMQHPARSASQHNMAVEYKINTGK